MFYKIIKDNKILEATTLLRYVRLSPKSGKILLATRGEAQGIISSDGKTVWHLKDYYNFPNGDYETVEAVEISEEEYRKITIFGGKTPEEIIDEYTLFLIEGGLL
jgi:hypothetical protein